MPIKRKPLGKEIPLLSDMPDLHTPSAQLAWIVENLPANRINRMMRDSLLVECLRNPNPEQLTVRTEQSLRKLPPYTRVYVIDAAKNYKFSDLYDLLLAAFGQALARRSAIQAKERQYRRELQEKIKDHTAVQEAKLTRLTSVTDTSNTTQSEPLDTEEEIFKILNQKSLD